MNQSQDEKRSFDLPNLPADELSALEKTLGYSFGSPELLVQALTHSSLGSINNERLEFLGDAVIGLVLATMLYKAFPDDDEGVLSRRRASIVCTAGLAGIARHLGVPEFLRLGPGEENTGGRSKPSNLENAVEAIFGAMYLDGGFDAVRDVVERVFASSVECSRDAGELSDYKSRLQELVMRDHPSAETPVRYTVVCREGPPHKPIFHIALTVAGREISTGTGTSKKRAEQEAAQKALEDTSWMTKLRGTET